MVIDRGTVTSSSSFPIPFSFFAASFFLLMLLLLLLIAATFIFPFLILSDAVDVVSGPVGEGDGEFDALGVPSFLGLIVGEEDIGPFPLVGVELAEGAGVELVEGVGVGVEVYVGVVVKVAEGVWV